MSGQRFEASKLDRRQWLKLSGSGLLAGCMAPWLPSLAARAAGDPARKRACILLWMSGGPSQMDTFDVKTGHENGGGVKEIQTAAAGVRIAEHFPTLARQMQDVVLVRSMSTKEGDHTRGTFLMRTGYRPLGAIRYPTLGATVSKELGQVGTELPNYISIAPYRFLSPAAFGAGFLGPQHAPLVVGNNQLQFVQQNNNRYENELRVRNLDHPQDVSGAQFDARLGLLEDLEQDFSSQRPAFSTQSHRTAYEQAVRMMRSEARQAFDLSGEPDKLRDAYGRNLFGQGCLLARRLVEQGVPFVEVSLNGVSGTQAFGWDTHQNNAPAVKSLCEVLDPGWGTLIQDLRDRGLLETTLVVWMGEFGRTPKINRNNGRDHYPNAWSTVLAGGGIQGGGVVGSTSRDGTRVEDRPVSTPDLLATICLALGVDPRKQNMSNVGRPIRIADPDADPMQEILA